MQAKNHMNFTKRGIEKLVTLDNKPFTRFYDEKVGGLLVKVMASGVKTFYFTKKIKGRVYESKIGRFPYVSVEQARKKTHRYNADAAQGVSPQGGDGAPKSTMTFGELHHWYIENHAKPHKVSYSVKEEIDMLRRYLLDWKECELAKITPAIVGAKHKAIGKLNGIYAANRTLSLISSMFNRAIDMELWSGKNPASRVKKFKEESRERFLQEDELPRFLQALEEETNPTKDFFYLALMTGVRKTNVLAMQWQDIDFFSKVWTIPKTKNGDSLVLPLMDEAIEVLQKRKGKSGWDNSPYVFPGKGGVGHLKEIRKVWCRILERAGIVNLRIHDLRRTFGSWQAITGSSGVIISKSLGHKSPRATAVYARVNIAPVRDSMSRATQAMLNTRSHTAQEAGASPSKEANNATQRLCVPNKG